MAAVVARLRAELRARWLAWMGVAVIAGLGGGIVVGLLDGAARTTNAYADFAGHERAADVVVAGRSPFGLAGAVDLDVVERLPQVRDTARASVSLLFTGTTDDGRRLGPVDVLPIAPADDRLASVVERWSMLEGRPADPNRVHEATASFLLADRLDLHVGSRVRLHYLRASSFARVAGILLSQFGPRLAGDPAAQGSAFDRLVDGPDITFRIVGIEASPAEFPPLGPDLSPTLHLTTAFTRKFGSEIVSSPLLYVRLQRPELLDAFAKGVERLAAGQPAGFVQSRALLTPKVERTIHVQGNAIRVVALLALVALVFVVGQALLRQAYAEADDDRVLRALGMRRTDLLWLAAGRGLLTGAAAGVVALAGSILVSPLMPLGLARTADLHPGVVIRPLTLALTGVAVVSGVVVLRLVAAWRVGATTSNARRRRRPAITRFVERASLPPAVGVGARFAVDPGTGTSAVPIWSTVLGATLTIGLLAGLWSFQASLQHLLDTPRLYGWNWTVKSGAPGLPDVSQALLPAFQQDPTIAAFASGTVTQAELGLQRVDVLAVQQRLGTVGPTLVQGRLPRRADEVVLGTRTLEQAHLRVGSIAVLRLGNTAAGLHVVGRAVFPEFGDAGRLGNGVLMTYPGLQRLLPDAQQNTFLIRFRPGTDVSAEVSRLRRALEPIPTRASGRPRELQELADVKDLPAILGGLLALLAAATLAHTLVTSVRRRRRDLAILETMGFVRRQMWLTVVCQTSTLVGVALLLGLPLGALVGRFAWSVFVDGLGAVREPQVAWLPIIATVPAALFLANAIAALPGWLAARVRPAIALRGE